jgi:hypothetical protein
VFSAVRLLAALAAFVLAILAGLALPIGSSSTAYASTGDIRTCKFGPAQVFDTQWGISGSTLNVSGLTRPWASTGPLGPGDIDADDYFAFVDATLAGQPTLAFHQYTADGTLKRSLHTFGSFPAIGEDFIFYNGSNSNGTLITTGLGYAYGSSASLAVTTNNPPLSEVLAYASCSSTPLGVGVTRASVQVDPDPTPDPVIEASSTPVALATESSIGLDLRGRTGQPAFSGQVEIFGTKLPEGTPYSLELFAPQRALETGTAPISGNVSSLVALPADLAPGSYTIVFRTELPSGVILVLHRVFVVAEDGTFSDLGVNIVGAPATPTVLERLAYTGLRATSLPWWALTSLLLGTLLVAYSVRAHRLVEMASLEIPTEAPRTPWEILATPIRVPGIDYIPGTSGDAMGAPTLAESIRELDLALSRMIVERLHSLPRLR